MAQWDGTTNSIIRPYRHPSGSFPVRYYEESTCAATAVIKRGDIVTFDTVVATASHRILRAPSSGGTGTNLLQVGIRSLVGVAAENSTSDGSVTGLTSNGLRPSWNRKLGVFLATPETEFIGFMSTAGAVSSQAVLSTLIGVQCPVTYSRTLNRFLLDSTNVTTSALFAVVITDIPSESIGDTNGPVVFKFLSTNVAANAAQ